MSTADKEEMIRQLQSLRYHADFALDYIKGDYCWRHDNVPADSDHPQALFCIGPFAIYDRFHVKSPKVFPTASLIVSKP